MGTYEWWKGLSIHLWRVFFSVREGNGYDALSRIEQNQYDVCERILITRFGQSDQDILRAYYQRGNWNLADDRYVIEDYSARTGIGVNHIWRTIKAANRAVAEELNIIDRKKNGDDNI